MDHSNVMPSLEKGMSQVWRDSPIVFLIGPTAIGKSGLAIQLAQQFKGEIVSLDSALIYRGMDIGTAKPTKLQTQQVPHHLMDIIDPIQPYSVAQFCLALQAAVAKIVQRGKIPFIVGGTMMYYHALFAGLDEMPGSDPLIRSQLQHQLQSEGVAAMHARLAQADPLAANRTKERDAQRILRALEVFEMTQKPLSSFWGQRTEGGTGDFAHALSIALVPGQRAALHQRIATRCQMMMQNGLVDELQALQQQYPTLCASDTAMRCIGYRQANAYLMGRIQNLEALEAQIMIATRQLAKRQLTWLRKQDMQDNHVFLEGFSPDILQQLSDCICLYLHQGKSAAQVKSQAICF